MVNINFNSVPGILRWVHWKKLTCRVSLSLQILFILFRTFWTSVTLASVITFVIWRVIVRRVRPGRHIPRYSWSLWRTLRFTIPRGRLCSPLHATNTCITFGASRCAENFTFQHELEILSSIDRSWKATCYMPAHCPQVSSLSINLQPVKGVLSNTTQKIVEKW